MTNEIEIPGQNAQGQLRSIIERVERLNDDRDAIMADRSEVYAEAKSSGFDNKIIRKIVTLRRQDKARRDEEAALIDLYSAAIGGL